MVILVCEIIDSVANAVDDMAEKVLYWEVMVGGVVIVVNSDREFEVKLVEVR